LWRRICYDGDFARFQAPHKKHIQIQCGVPDELGGEGAESPKPAVAGTSNGSTSPESTVALLARAREGDEAALNQVFARAIPLLKRWASGRLPRWARDMVDTDDLVQDTVINTLKRIDVFEYRADAALQAYLRQAVMNRIRNEIRRATRHPAPETLDSAAPDAGMSPLEELIGRQTVEAYDEAMAQLDPGEREAIVGRVELGLSYDELASAMGRPSPDAARMAVGRAILKLARLLKIPG
jgi:RNA polymerase sigma-70 factor (ECF subfamily)